jgi:oligoribonuclease (3'-5' exoribonuclease)
VTLVYLDCETTGLDPERHQVWEIAYAVDDGPIKSTFVDHTLEGADPEALVVGRYRERHRMHDMAAARNFEDSLIEELSDATLVGANPAFDAAFLAKRWGRAPWHYRLLDVCAYTAGTMGLDYVPGLAECAEQLQVAATPDHTAFNDTATAREVYRAAQELALQRAGKAAMYDGMGA